MPDLSRRGATQIDGSELTVCVDAAEAPSIAITAPMLKYHGLMLSEFGEWCKLSGHVSIGLCGQFVIRVCY